MMGFAGRWTESLRDGDTRIAQSVALVRHLPMIVLGNGLSAWVSVITLGSTMSATTGALLVLGMWLLLAR